MLRDKLPPLSENLKLPFPGESYLPPCTDREFWNGIEADRRELILREGREAAGEELPVLKATHYREYHLNGNRVNFEKIYFSRRLHLFRLTKAYCVEPSDDLLDRIIDDLDSLCGEWSWVLPAHNAPPADPYPPAEPTRVDLFAGSSSSLLALTIHLLREPLTRDAERLVSRVAAECRRRCLTPYMNNDSHWWMGYLPAPGHGPLNNWTPWITDNFLHTLFLLETDKAVLAQGVRRASEILTHYLDVLPEDGGCDEGPGYWDHAIGSLFDCLEILHWACGKETELLSDPFLAKAAGYIASLHICGDYFVNFADCPGRLPHLPGDLIRRMGRALNNSRLIALSGILREEARNDRTEYEAAFSSQRGIRDLAVRWKGEAHTEPERPLREVFPLSQTGIIRRSPYTFACKGGHNDESHNHNDIGQFILYGRKAPLLIDPGVGDYTRETFNEMRYTIWTMQSGWHNLPSVNGKDQAPGKGYRCTRFAFDRPEEGEMEIGGAYPPEGKILSLVRSFRFAESEIRMKDSWELREEPADMVWHFLSLDKPSFIDSQLHIVNPAGEKVMIRSDRELDFTREYLPFPVDNEKLRAWKREGLWRSVLTCKGELPRKGESLFVFSLN